MKTIEKTFKRRDQIKHVPVLVRTEHAGVWFGTIHHKKGREIILKNAIRIWYWWAAKSISLSAVAIYGINQEKSRIAPTLPWVWIEAIEILPCNAIAAKSIQECPYAEARPESPAYVLYGWGDGDGDDAGSLSGGLGGRSLNENYGGDGDGHTSEEGEQGTGSGSGSDPGRRDGACKYESGTVSLPEF